MKRSKIFLILFLAVIAFSNLTSSQQNICGGNGEDDIILRLSSPTNAHGEIFGQNPQNPPYIEICYSDLFTTSGTPYSGTLPVGGIHACDSNINTPILRLSADSNAHAEISGGTTAGYTNLCYGDLSCRTTTGSCDQQREVEVLSLSALTNAHLEVASQSNYAQKICCSSTSAGTTAGFGTLEWQDFNNNLLTTPRSPPLPSDVCVGEWVKTYAATLNPSQFSSQTIDFDIFEDDTLSSDDYIKTVSGTIDSNGQVRGEWEITQDDYNNGKGPLESQLEFYFIARDPNDPNYATRDPSDPTLNSEDKKHNTLLDVNTCEPQVQNPQAQIIAPIHQKIYFSHDPDIITNWGAPQDYAEITFQGQCQSSSPATYEWTIKQRGFANHIETTPTFTYTFQRTNPLQNDKTGRQAEITLKCTDTAGNVDEEQVGILVVSSPGLFTFIDEPEHQGISYTPPVSGQQYDPKLAPFSGEDGYVALLYTLSTESGIVLATINPSLSYLCQGSCLAGNCPEPTDAHYKTAPYPLCSNINGATPTGEIIIQDLRGEGGLPDEPNEYDGLFFNWTFWDDSGWIDKWTSIEENSAGDRVDGLSTGVIQYSSVSRNLNDKHMSLNVSLPVGEIIESYLDGGWYFHLGASNEKKLSLEVQRDFTLGRCLQNGNIFIDDDNNLIPTTEPNACLGGDSLPNTGDECCPASEVCTETSTNPSEYNCLVNTGPRFCRDFTTHVTCNGNTDPRIPERSINGPLAQCEYAKCKWSPPNDPNGVCGVEITQNNPSQQGCVTDPGGPRICNWDIQQSECTNGQKTITYTNLDPSQTQCDKPDEVVPCGGLEFELNFFDYKNFIFSILIIAIIYLIIFNKKQNEN